MQRSKKVCTALAGDRFAQLPFMSLQDLMCCRDVYGLALFVHKCMKVVDAAATAAASAKTQMRLSPER
jgi:hypothetical protein